MTRYHVNPETGRANICRASVKSCPVAASESHYATKEEARAGYEKSMKPQELPTLKKTAAKAPASSVTPAPARPLTLDERRAAREKLADELIQNLRSKGFPQEPRKLPFVKTNSELKEEAREFESYHYYSPKEILEMRYVSPSEVMEEERYSGYVTVKIPSGSEARISTDLARQTLGMAPREKTEWDESPYRKLQILEMVASEGTFGFFDTEEDSRSARAHYSAIRKNWDEAQSLFREKFSRTY